MPPILPKLRQRLRGNKPRASSKSVRSNEALANSIQLDLTLGQQNIASQVVQEDFMSAKLARDTRDLGFDAKGAKRTFEMWHKEMTELYFGHRQPKTVPWRFASNRSLMIAMAIVEVLHARIFPAVWGEDITNWRPVEHNDEDRAQTISKLMFWWTRVHASQREFFDRWVRQAISFGRVLSEHQWKVTERDGEDGPTLIETTEPSIVNEEDIFLPKGASDVQKDPVVIRMKLLYRDLEAMERNGQALNITQPSVPNQRTLKELLPVSAPTDADVAGLSEAQQDELANVKRRNLELEVLKEYLEFDLNGDGRPEQVRLLTIPDHQLYIGGVKVKDLSSRGLRPIDLTQYLTRLGEPQGLSGLGALEQVFELAKEIDAIFNQLTDGNTLSVLRPGFIDAGGQLDIGALNLAPNKLTPIPNPNQSVFFPDFQIPTEKLLLAIRTVLEFIERLTAASAFVLGKESEIVGGSGTATRTAAIVGAADRRHAIPAERLRDGASRIETVHLDLLQKNLPLGLETRVIGNKGEPVFDSLDPATGQPMKLTRDSIKGQFDAFRTPDDTLGNKETQRVLADQLYAILVQNPLILQDPAKLYKVTADFALKPREKEPETFLGPEPEINPARSPEDEHTLMLQGEFGKVKVTAAQNPLEHILAHQNFAQDPGFLSLVPELQNQISQFLQAHIQEHIQLLQQQLQLQAQAPKGQPPKGGTNGNPQQGAPGGRGQAAPTTNQQPSVGAVQNPLEAGTRARQPGVSQNT